MKIRSGFVSNSSSSSFCIYGAEVSVEDLVKMINVFDPMFEYDEDMDTYDLCSDLSEHLSKNGYKVQAFRDGPEHIPYLGRRMPPKDDETYAEFKKSIEEFGDKATGGTLNYYFHQDGWYS